MNIRYGSTRLAFVGEKTIKIPSPLVIVPKDGGAPRFSKGWEANALEAQYAQELEGIVVPTRMLCGGLLIEQPTTPDIPEKCNQWIAIGEALGDGNLRRGTEYLKNAGVAHTVENPDNFGMYNSSILFRDFGDKAVIQFLLEHGSLIREALQKLLQGFSSVSQSPITNP